MPKFPLFLAIAASALLTFASCQEEEPFLNASPGSISFESCGGVQIVNVRANYPWTASVSGSGFTISPSSGEGDCPISVTAESNSSSDDITGTITFTSQGLTASVALTQNARNALILLGGEAIIPAEGGSYSTDIQYNVDYSVTVDRNAQDWIKVVRTKSLESGKIEFFFEPNNTTDERSGKVAVQANDFQIDPVIFTFTQQAARSIIVDGNSVDVPYSGGSYTFGIQFNTDYDVTVEDDAAGWIRIVRTKAMESGTIEVSVDRNTAAARTGYLTVSDPDARIQTQTITFNQEAGADFKTLENIYYSWGGPNWSIKTNWLSSKPLSEWYGVSTDEAGEVTALDLSGVGLVGQVPPALSSLNSLTSIGLSNNPDLSGTLPETIFNSFEYLESLQLQNCGFYGQIPENWGNLPATCSTLLLYGNELMGDVPVSVTSHPSWTEGKWDRWIDASTHGIRTQRSSMLGLAADKEANLAHSVQVLKDIYDSMDGAHWDFQGGTEWFSTEYPSGWGGVWLNENNEITRLYLEYFGLKGKLPESIGELSALEVLYLDDAGITGSLPASMSNLTELNYLRIQHTSMTSLTDIFSEKMDNLEWIEIDWNTQMGGPVPAGLAKLPAAQSIDLSFNALTGTPDASLAPLHIKMSENRLTGPISDDYFKDYDSYKGIINQQEGYGFDLSKYDLAGGYPAITIPDIISGEDIDFPKLISESKYTVYLFWAPWCPFSKSLMPQLVSYYKKYHQDGLEIVATVTVSDEIGPIGNLPWDDKEGQIKEINDKGYGIWYNFFYPTFEDKELELHPYDNRCWYFASTPQAEVYDSKGNIVFSASVYDDPVRNRFNKSASVDLMPFLESLFGPLEEEDDYESKDYSTDGQVLALQKASKGNGIDIVFMGDGYTDRDMGKGGLYETVMKESMEEFFAIEPYRTFRDRFNVYAIKAVSKNGRVGEGYDTAFSTTFGKGTEVNGNTVKAFEYASKAVSSTDNILVCIMVNSQSHKGTNVMFKGQQSSVAWTSTYGNDRQYFGSTLRHEAGGHGFGFLADEYVTYSSKSVPESVVANMTELWNGYGWYANVDFTSDPSKVKWASFISDGRYNDEVGIFEGAGYYGYGAYRPSQNSMMNENMEYFNAPSRLAIYKRIMTLSGEGYSFEKFLDYDAVNRTEASKASRIPQKSAARPASRPWEATNPPIVMP